MRLFFIILTCLFFSCSQNSKQANSSASVTNDTTKSQVTFLTDQGSVTFQVEIAQTPLSREKGLMFRTSLDQNAGMLFVFTEDAEHPFWMKNTVIPLDIIFLDNQKKVVGIVENAKPLSLQQLSVQLPNRFVLEINGGLAKERGIKKNTQAIFSISPP